MGKQSGFLLTEVLLALAIFSLLLVTFSLILLASLQAGHFSSQEIKAQSLLSETLEIARIIRPESWDNLTNGTFYPQFSGAEWTLVATTSGETIGSFVRSLEISNVFRNQQGDLVETGGLLDPSTKKITVSVTWHGFLEKTVQGVTLLTRYLDNLIWRQTTQAEFDAGDQEYVETTLVDDGEVQLQGGCLENPSGPLIYDEEFQNTWEIHPSAAGNIREITSSEGEVYEGEKALELSSFSGANTKVRNIGGICTLGYKRMEFYAYNNAAIPQSFQFGGTWDGGFLEITIPSQSWEFVSLLYSDVVGGTEENCDFIFFKAGSDYQPSTIFYLDNYTLAGGVGGYYQLGTLTSSVFDAGQTSAFNRLEFDANLPANTSIGFQLATSDDPSGPWLFSGPGGTDQENDLYSTSGGEGVRFPGNVGRYARYKAFLKSDDGEDTPILFEARINYSP